MYEESVAVPLLVAGPGIEPADISTPVSLIDLSETILDHFNGEMPGRRPGRSLYEIAAEPADDERVVFSEYHAAGAVSGAFMIRKGRWKYIHYVDFPPELFDLDNDPEELCDLAPDPAFATIIAELHANLRAICNPEAVDRQAHFDQRALIKKHGGREAALKLGAPGATPAPIIQEGVAASD
jgi:choline-sulfatase